MRKLFEVKGRTRSSALNNAKRYLDDDEVITNIKLSTSYKLAKHKPSTKEWSVYGRKRK